MLRNSLFSFILLVTIQALITMSHPIKTKKKGLHPIKTKQKSFSPITNKMNVFQPI